MDRTDLILLWIVTVIAFVTAGLRILLAKRKGEPLGAFWTVQSLVFPVLLLLALVLFQTKTADIVLPAVIVGLLEELLCGSLRRRKQDGAHSHPEE